MTEQNSREQYNERQRERKRKAESYLLDPTESLGLEHEQAFRDHVMSAPPQYRRSMVLAAMGLTPPSDAIRIKCAECCGFEEVLTRVRECKCWRCPLHAYRPYQD